MFRRYDTRENLVAEPDTAEVDIQRDGVVDEKGIDAKPGRSDCVVM